MKISKIEKIHYDEPVAVYDIFNAASEHNFITKDGIIIKNCGVMDEVNFHQTGVKDINKAKQHTKELYDTIVARVQGTFRMNGKVYGKVFCVSSKNSDSDFLEEHVQNQLKAGNEHMYVVDKPQWEVMPPTMFSKERFHIAVGDRYHKGFVVDDESEESLAELREQGYQLLEAPVDVKTNFLADFDIALRDIAGISVPGALSFITQDIIDGCTGTRKNPFLNDILEIGMRDNYSIEEFFHLENVDPSLKSCACFLHLDLSLNDDKSGLGGVFISGRRDIKGEDGRYTSLPVFTHFFSVSIKAPRGDKIPYSKILNFILWLRRQGFDIQSISRDQFQSEYIAQLLEEQGFKVNKISVDRTPDPYEALRSIFVERRIDLLPVNLLQEELIHLQRDSISGKVDHPVGGCIIGNTIIQLVDGRQLSVYALLHEQETGNENYVYTVNEETFELEVKKIKKVFCTKTVRYLDVVILSNGCTVTCTPEHRFMLGDGTYSPAFKLFRGMKLMSYGSGYVSNSYSVLSVQLIECVTEVYDLEIEDNHNFALATGVFIHNSKDTADCIAGSVWNAMTENPGVPVDRSEVANTIFSVNSRSTSKQDDLNYLFRGNIRKF